VGLFLLGEPPERRVAEILESSREAPFSYAEVGASREGPETLAGYVVDRNRVKLGEGATTFDRAVEALWSWRMFDLGWVRLLPADAAVEAGTTVGVLARHYGFWSLNVSRVVYEVRDDDGPVRRRGFAYGTLPEHAACGEERFTIELREDGSVYYDLYAFSRPNYLLAKVGRPVARGLQRRFARDSLGAMVRAAGGR
jgi:uncharacterized protein (UPF0548 family)